MKKKNKRKKYVNKVKCFSRFPICLLIFFFIINFSIFLSINISTYVGFKKDIKVQQVYTKEIEFGYSKLSGKNITLAIDKSNNEEIYYFISNLPNLDNK